MHPIITDKDTGRELWRVKECAAYIGITPAAWTNYAANGRTPEKVAHLDRRTPLWDANEVKNWHANRPGSPVRNNPAERKQFIQ